MRTATLLSLLALAPAVAADPPKKPVYEFKKQANPQGTGKFYLGREIAPVMGYEAAGWLDRTEREKEEEPAKLIKALDLKPGMVVADVGAGSGYHCFLMSPLVGEKGKVIACDVQPEMLDIVEARSKRKKIKNIELARGTETDPKLPPGEVDLIIMVDVYHEFSHPYEMTEKLVEALKPGGRLVFVEFRLEDDKVPIKLVHKMSERQVIKEMAEFPILEHEKTVSSLPWQHVILFKKKAK